MRIGLGAVLAGLVLLAPVASHAAMVVEEANLLASDGANRDEFGGSVAVAGDTAVVGAMGAAYVFRYDGTGWIQEDKLTDPDGTSGDLFGRSVAVAGDVAVVGASSFAYIFRYDGVDWLEEKTLTAPPGAGEFGVSVAVAGDTAVVGAEGDSLSGSAAYVFRYNGVDWVEEKKLIASDGTQLGQFGNSVAVAGDVAVVGAAGDTLPGGSPGAAYVFRYDGTDWVEEATLTAPLGSSPDLFGVSVAVAGGVAVVGAAWDDDNGFRSGSAYVFRYSGTVWAEEAKLLASDGAAFEGFGILGRRHGRHRRRRGRRQRRLRVGLHVPLRRGGLGRGVQAHRVRRRSRRPVWRRGRGRRRRRRDRGPPARRRWVQHRIGPRLPGDQRHRYETPRFRRRSRRPVWRLRKRRW